MGKERKRGDSQPMTTNGGKEKPPTRDRHQKKRRIRTGFGRLATGQSESEGGEEEGRNGNASHGVG